MIIYILLTQKPNNHPKIVVEIVMTAELNVEGESSSKDSIGCYKSNDSTETEAAELPPEIMDIFGFLSLNKSIIFKSQQIDDPEIEREEKVQIAHSIYKKNRQTFLMRFGGYLEEHHLEVFARLVISDGVAALQPDEHCNEIQYLIKDYQRRLHTRKQDVKNRRYAALKRLEDQGEYFSEQEMMKREPTLYQELVGQYLSEAEKKQRDNYDVKNTTFSGILMHSLEKQELQDLLKQAERSNQINEDDNTSYTGKNEISPAIQETPLEDDIDDIPPTFRQQWGNFDDEKIACTSSEDNTISKLKRKAMQQKSPTLITAGERDLLRQEFVGLMHEHFLAGHDEDFDYAQVDNNSVLDDLCQLDQDKEDAYFQESEDEEQGAEQHIESVNEDSRESMDELDIYMSHLNKHHSLQN